MKENRERKRRSDYGQIQMTRRDMEVLRWMGEMYAVRVDHLALLLGRMSKRGLNGDGKVMSREGTRRIYTRWLNAGWVEKRKMLADEPQWIWLSKQGVSDVGSEYPYRVPSVARLRHIHAVNAVRLHVEERLGSSWTCERELSREKREHLIDGLVLYEGRQTAIEIEMTQKSKKRLVNIVRDLCSEYGAVWYFVDANASLASLGRAIRGARHQ